MSSTSQKRVFFKGFPLQRARSVPVPLRRVVSANEIRAEALTLKVFPPPFAYDLILEHSRVLGQYKAYININKCTERSAIQSTNKKLDKSHT